MALVVKSKLAEHKKQRCEKIVGLKVAFVVHHDNTDGVSHFFENSHSFTHFRIHMGNSLTIGRFFANCGLLFIDINY